MNFSVTLVEISNVNIHLNILEGGRQVLGSGIESDSCFRQKKVNSLVIDFKSQNDERVIVGELDMKIHYCDITN